MTLLLLLGRALAESVVEDPPGDDPGTEGPTGQRRMSALSTLDDLAPDLGITIASTGTAAKRYQRLLESASQTVIKYLRYDPALDERTEIYSGFNSANLRLKRLPVHSIANVWVDQVGSYGAADGAFDDSTLKVQGVDYALAVDQPDGTSRGATLVRLNGVWPGRFVRPRGLLSAFQTNERGNIKVQYTAGWCPMPEPIVTAVHMLVARAKVSMPYGGVMATSERLGEASYSLQSIQSLDPLDPVRSMLDPYRRLGSA